MKFLFLIALAFLVGCSDSAEESDVTRVNDKHEENKHIVNRLDSETLDKDLENRVSTKSITDGVTSEPSLQLKENEQPELSSGHQPLDSKVSDTEAARLEASILSSTLSLTNRQAAQSEQVSIDELENLSEAARQALSEQSAESTARAAEEKAESQAASAALRAVEVE